MGGCRRQGLGCGIVPQDCSFIVAPEGQGKNHPAVFLLTGHGIVLVLLQNLGSIFHSQPRGFLFVCHRRHPQLRRRLGRDLQRDGQSFHAGIILLVCGVVIGGKGPGPHIAHLLVRGLPGKSRAGVHCRQRAAIYSRQSGGDGIVRLRFQDMKFRDCFQAGVSFRGGHHGLHIPGACLVGYLFRKDAVRRGAVAVQRLAVLRLGMGGVCGLAVGPVLQGEGFFPAVADRKLQGCRKIGGAVGVAVGHNAAVLQAAEHAAGKLRPCHIRDAVQGKGHAQIVQIIGSLPLGQLYRHGALPGKGYGRGRIAHAHCQQQVVAGQHIGEFCVGAEIQIAKVAALDAQLFQVGCLGQIQLGYQGVGAPQVQQAVVAGQSQGPQGAAQIQKVRHRLVAGQIQAGKEVITAGQFLQLRQRGHIQCRQAVIVAVKQLQAGNLSQVQGGELVFIAQQPGQPRKLLQRQRSQFIADAVQIGKPGKAADALQGGNAFAADIQAGHRVTFCRGQNPVAVGIQLADASQKGGVRKMSAVQRHPGIGRSRRCGRHIQRCLQGVFRGGGFRRYLFCGRGFLHREGRFRGKGFLRREGCSGGKGLFRREGRGRGFRGGGLQSCLHGRGRVFLPKRLEHRHRGSDQSNRQQAGSHPSHGRKGTCAKERIFLWSMVFHFSFHILSQGPQSTDRRISHLAEPMFPV